MRQRWSIHEPCRVAASTPSGTRDHDRDDEAEQRELGGRRQAVADFGRDRLAGGQRVAEIAMREIVGVADELLGQRLVEAELLADLRRSPPWSRRARRNRPRDRRAARASAGR